MRIPAANKAEKFIRPFILNGVNRTSHSSNGLTLIEYIRAYNVVIQMERTVETSIEQYKTRIRVKRRISSV